MNEFEPQLTDAPEVEPVIQLADMPIEHHLEHFGTHFPPLHPPLPPAPGFDKTKLILPVSILIAAVLVSGSIFYTRSNFGENLVATIGTNPNSGAQVKIDLDGSPVLGNAKAPITIVEFGDYQCPFCQRYHQNNQPMFISEYVNTGKARFVWKDYAFLGQESLWAAEASRCANEQGKFWQYHDYLYNNQGAENSGAFSKDNLKKFALALGLNTTQFNACLDTEKYGSLVQRDTQAGSAIGVNGTPATFINGKLVVGPDGNSVGAAPFSVFKTVIDQELKK